MKLLRLSVCLAAPAFTPLSAAPPVAGPKVWLTAEQGIALDAQGAVERWEDQSGNGNHFEQTTATRRPVVMENAFGTAGKTLNRLPRYQNGNATYTGTLGHDFVVDREISVTALAAFDHLRDGLAGTITVQLRQRTDGGTLETPEDDTQGAILEQLTFTAADSGQLDGSYRWKPLPAPRTLAPGSYTLTAWGYTADSYFSSSTTPRPGPDAGVRWVGNARYGATPGEWPATANTPGQYAGAMNLRYDLTGVPAAPRRAVRFDGIDDGLQGLAGMNFGRPSSVFVVFEGETANSGYILQNTTGGNWWMRNDGFWAEGAVRSTELGWSGPHVAGMVSTADGTRAYLDFGDVTTNGSLKVATPNRLHLGGGGGRHNDPLEVKIAELLVYDRQLSTSEIWETQAYLAERFSLSAAPAEAPQILPAGAPGAGDVTVTLASGTPGAVIRYTTDGSDPGPSSTVYSGPVAIARGTEVRARAFAAGRADSGVSSQFYASAAAAELPVGGLSLWLRADRGVETDAAGKVTRWRDLTGNGNDMEQGATWQRPARTRGFPLAGGTAIQSLYGNAGANTHAGTLGTDFDVDEPIVIEKLGAFDHRGDGFAGAITVQIRARDHAGTLSSPADDTAGTILAEVEFTAAAPGTLDGATRFKPIAPLTLQPGSYSILAWGFTGANLYRNSSDATWLADGLRFVNSSRYGTANGAWPTTIDSHPVKYNGAGNFQYRKAAATAATTRAAIGFDGDDDGLWAVPASFLSRPGTVYLVFSRTSGGRMLQNSGGGAFYISEDGIYADGWLRNRTIPAGAAQIVAVSQSADRTRAWVNGEDWTLSPSTAAVVPGRLALGGGSGQTVSPTAGRVAEVIAFDRELSAAERWQVEDHLARKYTPQAVPLPPVAISPAANYGTGAVTVTLSEAVPGGTIRYTTDGSEPTAAAAAYAAPFSVARGTTVKARNFLSGAQPGPVAAVFYGNAAAPDALPVSGAKLWLRSDAGVDLDAAGGVARWRDLSGNGNDLVQPVAQQRPVVAPAAFALDGTPALRVPDGDGNTTYAGTLAEDFVVDQPVSLTHLGAFDHLRDGFSGTVTVQLWSRDDKGTPATQSDDSAGTLLAQTTFTAAAPGTLEGVCRFKPLAAPVALPAGAYTVMAWGYNGQNRYYEGSRGTTATDPRFRFIGKSRYHNTAGAWPNTLDSAALDYNGAANFKVAPAGTGGQPGIAFDGINDALRGVETMNFGRPSTVLAVFRRDRNESGYFLGSAGATNWWIRNDGFYAGAWINNENFEISRPVVATVVNAAGSTRAWRNGMEVTTDSTPATAAPGRLVLGGTDGQNNDPAPVSFAEVMVFDRVLTPSELWTLQDLLARRHAVHASTVALPAISPPSNFGEGPVQVTLATLTPGAEIRYTTDGSEPTAASALYGGAFSASRGTTVKARAFLAGLPPSPVASAYYGSAASHPLAVGDVAMWLRADTGVVTDAAGAVLRWQDLSGNGRDVVSRSPEKAPLHVAGEFADPVQPAVAIPAGTAGNLNFTGALGADFIVTEPVEITHLGAFDSFSDGFSGTVTVRLHAVDDKGTPAATDDASGGVLATRTFTRAAPGTLQGGCRYLALDPPLALAAGRYLIESQGWTGGDTYNNTTTWDETVGNGITMPKISRSSTATNPATLFPGTISSDNRHLAAGTFKSRKAGASGTGRAAVRFDGIDDGLLGPLDFSVGRPATVFLVFNQGNGADGRLLQSGSGQNWLLGPHVGTDGHYAAGWVTQHTLRRNVVSQVIAVQDTADSRYFHNGSDLTQDPNPTGILGRVALGGGEGTYDQPCQADVAELVVYNRVLSPAERQRVSARLAARYSLPLEPLLPPVASPDGGLFESARTVSLSHPIDGVEIRYTTDGSEPDAASPLYTAPFAISASATVKARAFGTGYGPSATQESVFIIDPAAEAAPQRQAMQLWLRAARGVEQNGGAVSRWLDQSGKGMDAVQPTAAARPAVDPAVIGGAPGLVFDGSNDFLQLPEGFRDFSQGLTAIFVMRSEGVGNWERLLDLGRGASNNNILFARSGTSTSFHFGTNPNGLAAPNSFLPASNTMFSVTLTPAGVAKIFVNGSLSAETTSFALPPAIVRTLNFIGKSNWSSDAYFKGAISEVILYNTTLGDLERETFESAIRAKYQIASSATGTVAFSPSPAQLYPDGTAVTLASATAGARIHYTTDGSAPTEASPRYQGPIPLTTSTRLRARAFADGFNASQFSEATYLIGQPPANGDGLLADYFDTIDLTGPALTRVDPAVNFAWGSGSPDPALEPDSFSVRWTGKVMPRFSETYQFFTSCDDGARLWVDLNRNGTFEDATELLINDWTSHTETERASAAVSLVAGQLYAIRMEYYESTSTATARLRWSSAFSEPKAIIPQSQLFSNAPFNQTVVTPVISPPGGTHTAAVQVTIATATPGATVYYTTDGSVPDSHSPVYGGPIAIGSDAVVKARAFKAGFNPSGVATASYQIDAVPPTITQFAWNGAPLTNGTVLTGKGTLSATATDSQGIASAEFYYLPAGAAAPVLIGRDTSPANGLSAAWDIAQIQDGAYTAIVRVFDTSGIWSEMSRNIAVNLAVPAAPQIVQPASGITVQDPVVALKIQTLAGASIRIFRDDVFIFSGYAGTGGVLDYSAPLPAGTSTFKAVALNRAGPSAASNAVTVTRVREFPQIALTFSGTTVGEGTPVLGTVTVPTAPATPLTVNITTNKASQMENVPPVVIAAGQTSATFTLSARQDTEIELLSTLQVTAAAAEHRSAVTELFLADDDYPEITLTLDQTSVPEKQGNVIARVTRTPATDRPLRILISNSKPSEVTAPAYVDIPGGQTSAVFTLAVLDDDAADGNQPVTFKGEVVVSGTVVATTAAVVLEVRDDEGPLLTVEPGAPVVSEGGSISALVRRSGTATTHAVQISLGHSPAGQLTLPATVTIPAGQSTASFTIAAPVDSAVSGSRAVTLRATAAGHTDGFAPLTVTDASLPELAPSQLAAPASALSEQYAAVSFRVDNHGFAPAKGPFVERIFLSADPSPSADDALVRQIDFTGEMAAGANYLRNVTVLMPRQAGLYYLIVTVDAGGAVAEIDEANNTAVLARPIEVRPAYQAEVWTDVTTVPANTPIVFQGTATRDGGGPAANSMVNIHIRLGGSTRVISAVTNSAGNFTTTWTPLRNEGGLYNIGAAHPGATGAPEQDAFEILTLGFDPPATVRLNEGETAVAQATLRNPNARPLTGLVLRVGELPAGLSISPQLPATTLAAGAEMKVPVTVAAAAGFAGTGTFALTVETAEGVTMQAALGVRAELLKPVLTLEPAALDASVLRGSSRTVSFTVTNTGGLATGPVQLLLPDVPWLSVVSANPLASLPPGGSAAVSLALAPGATVPLTLFSGNLALNPANGGSRAVPYRFRVVSDLKGDLEIEVQDELTFFTQAAPRLAGARVTVRDAISSAEIASKETGADGLAKFTGLTEGWYRVDVSAPDHDSFTNNYYLAAGQPNHHEAFISKRLVKYSWKVEEVEIEDVYRVKVETTFETNVPAPVVTATPGTFDLSDLTSLGQVKTVNVTLENHGFIAAQESAFRFSEHPFYEFTPLVTNIGTIPAKSSLVVPVQIRRIGVFDDAGGIVTLGGGTAGLVGAKHVARTTSVPCSAAGAVDYNYPCGPHLVSRVVQLAMNGVQGSCGGTSNPNAGREYLIELNRFYGDPRGGWSSRDGGLEPTGGVLSLDSLDPCTLLCFSRAALDCVVGFGPTPLACSYAAANCVASNGDALTCAGAGLCWAGPVVNGGFCVLGAINCVMPFSGPILGGRDVEEPGFILTEAARNYAPPTAEAWAKVEPTLEMAALILGNKERVLMQRQPGMEQMMAALGTKTAADSAGGSRYVAEEITALQQLAASVGLAWELFQPIVERWNRTLDYRDRGIFNPEDVPAGESQDFIPRDMLQFLAQQVIEAQQQSQAAGFVDPFHEFSTRSAELREELTGGQGGTCAKVKIELSQDLMMTRTAFRATLELQNERDEELTGVGFNLRVRDAAGLPAEDLFNIQITKLTGLDAADGSGGIGSRGKGTVQWTLIPRDTAALETEMAYTVGGTIRYVQGATEFNIPVENVPIRVRPDASLSLKYFHQRDVFSDDPHTDVVEPAEPYKLAVMVENNGHGTARNLKIVSGQPQIVDNEKGLFVDFKVIGTEVDGQPLSPSLTADFGQLAPGQRKIATWLMTSTLQGLFLDYKATFEHVTGLGDKRISLLQNVEIHEMNRMVRDQRPGADSAPDFLVNDVADANDYPDTIHYSHGGSDLVTVRQAGSFNGVLSPQNPSITLTTGAFSGWSYIRLPDPGNGTYRLVSVTRADGRVLPLDFNAWQTNRTFIGGGRQPRYENILHLVDADSSGSYTLVYQPAAAADSTPPQSRVTALAGSSPAEIPVFWSGTDNVGIANYDVHVAVDGGPFTLWKERTTATGAIFQGAPGKQYAFYSIARDAAGNVETKAAAAEATTSVGISNQPPVLAAIPAQSVDEGSIFTYRASATDPDGPAGDIRFSLGSAPAGMVIHPQTGVISWTTGETDGGRTVNVTVVATDSAAVPGVATRSFALTVVDINSPPTLSPVGPQTLQANGVLLVHARATDGDSPAQTITYSLPNAPAGATIHPVTGVIGWSPAANQTGSHGFTVRATDNGSPARFAETGFSVTVVAPANRPPHFTKVPVVLWIKGRSYSLTVSAADADGDAISLAANLAGAAGATFTDQGNGIGQLGWNLTDATAGTYSIPLTATANGASTAATVKIRVAEDNLYWTWARDEFGALPDAFDLALLDMTADPDGDGRGNVHEMALLTKPLTPDSVPLRMTVQKEPPFAMIGLRAHRRKGSEAFVDLGIDRSPGLPGAWNSVPNSDWTATLDAAGDDDGRPESESVDFRIFEHHPAGLPARAFYRLRTTLKPQQKK